MLAEPFDGAGTVDVEESGDGVNDETSVVVPLDMTDDVVATEGVVVSVNVMMVSEVAGTVDVEASGTAGDVLEAVVLLASKLSNVGAVDVELTKGGSFSIYKPLGCTA